MVLMADGAEALKRDGQGLAALEAGHSPAQVRRWHVRL